VQRDLLPLLEEQALQQNTVQLKTDHILFIASGAFHLTKTRRLASGTSRKAADKVELKALVQDDFIRY
jgi:ATP-dependent HslUV protease ATP-binding subunit HslU